MHQAQISWESLYFLPQEDSPHSEFERHRGTQETGGQKQVLSRLILLSDVSLCWPPQLSSSSTTIWSVRTKGKETCCRLLRGPDRHSLSTALNRVSISVALASSMNERDEHFCPMRLGPPQLNEIVRRSRADLGQFVGGQLPGDVFFLERRPLHNQAGPPHSLCAAHVVGCC